MEWCGFITFTWIFLSVRVSRVEMGTVERIYIKDNAVAIKGGDLEIICEVSEFQTSNTVGIYKFGTIPNSLSGQPVLSQCNPSMCIGSVERHTFIPSSTSVTIAVTLLNRQEDEKWWICAIDNQREQLFITVYTPPKSLVLTGKTGGGNLETGDVTLKCEADCMYPASTSLQWFYTEDSSQWLHYKNVTTSGSQISCGDSEKKYTAELQLPRYTIWPSNVETTVKFQCRLDFPALQSSFMSNESGNVAFAVRVTALTLKDGEKTLTSSDTTEAVVGRNKTYTCIPTTSRPAATITWYIGSSKKQESTNTEYRYTPAFEDNSKKIYCTAFNIPGQTEVVSKKPVLLVNAKVVSVSLHDGDSTLGRNDDIVVTENQNKNLTCRTGNANPAPIIEWYFNDAMKQNGTNAKFMFTPTKNDHGKRVYCKAYNIYNIQPVEEKVESANPKLYVRVLATTPTLTNKTTSSLVLFENDTVKMECISSPTRPAAIVTWRKGLTAVTNVHNTNFTVAGDLLSVRSVVTLTPRRSDNSKYVYCETVVPGQQNKPASQQRIAVYWPPSLPAIPVTDLPFLENQTGKTLSCFSDEYGNPGSEAIWDSRYGTLDSSNSRILNLPRLTPDMDKSQVSCQLGNTFTRVKGLQLKSATISLDVEFAPRVQILEHGNIVQTVTKNEGEALSVSCEANGNPPPTVSWERQTSGSSELKFTDIDRTNHGIYTCRAEASSSKYPADIFVTEQKLSIVVYYAPEINITFSETQPTENTSLLITCTAVGRSNLPTSKSLKQTWNSLTIPNTNNFSDGALQIEKLQLQDSGTYVCIANNGIPGRNHQIDQTGKRELKVKVSPEVLLEDSHIFAGAPGKSVNLSVPFYSYPGIQAVMFKFPNDSEIVNSVRYNMSLVRSKVTTTFYGQQVELEGYNATLHIRDEEESDFVNYTLVLDNGIGQRKEWTLFHVSESIPLAPKLFNFTGLVNGVPTFLLVGNFNGGRVQTFVIETTVQGKEEWKGQLMFSETDRGYLQKEKLTFRFNITGLSPDTYEVRVITRNVLGSIINDDAPKVTFTIEEEPVSGTSLPLGAIAGSISGVVVLAAVVAIVIIWKKRFQSKDGSSKAICKRPGDDDSSDDEVITENLAYVSAEEVSGPNALNAKMQGNKKSVAVSGDIYASVNKTKAEDLGSLYAMPNKKGLKNKGKGIQRGRAGKDGKTGKKKQIVNEPDNVYENAAEMKPVSTKSKMGGTDERNLYEIPEQTKPAPKKNMNKDGLIYADLDFKHQSKGQKKLIIHGLDDMTEYITVDFTKKADPLPDSDE